MRSRMKVERHRNNGFSFRCFVLRGQVSMGRVLSPPAIFFDEFIETGEERSSPDKRRYRTSEIGPDPIVRLPDLSSK